MAQDPRNWCTLSFGELIETYRKVQTELTQRVKELAGSSEEANPGKFLLLQFQMSQVTQIGDSISNLIAQVQSMINATIRNQRVSG